MRHLKQTQIQHSSELLEEVEAEAEGSHDVEMVQKNLGLLVQLCEENFLEGVQSVGGTRLVELD